MIISIRFDFDIVRVTCNQEAKTKQIVRLVHWFSSLIKLPVHSRVQGTVSLIETNQFDEVRRRVSGIQLVNEVETILVILLECLCSF